MFNMRVWTGVLGVLAAVCGSPASALLRENLYPYGVEQGDTRLEVGDDVSSTEIRLDTPVQFYDNTYYSIFVNSNGHLSFETEVPVYRSALIFPIGFKVIAPFLADIDTSLSGNIYYRQTHDPSLLLLASDKISDQFFHRGSFRPVSLFIATWDEVGYFREQYDYVNTFQVVLASDGRDTYVFFHYPSGGLNWLRGAGKQAPSIRDVAGQAGFDAGDNWRYYTLPGSGNDEVRNLQVWSNLVPAEEGVWLFRVGRIERIIETPDSPQEAGERGTSEVMTCDAGGARHCDADAICNDYASGFCCECQPPYFGNGHNCLQPGEPQRINGKLSGTINRETLEEVDMHVYVVTSDGRAYTAVSRIPPQIGWAMLSLYTIGGVMGWLFAVVTSPGAMNGFQLTGGDFNRTATMTFGTGEVMNITQMFFGQGVGYMRVTTVLDGNTPRISQDARVTVEDYREEYRRISAGILKSYTNQRFLVDEVPYQFTLDQTITFWECSARPLTDVDTLRLSATRNFLVYGERENIIRYAVTSTIGTSTGTGADPCEEGRRSCDANASCLPSGDGFVCECRPGYRGDGRRCEDIDECSLGYAACHPNARCLNNEGSYDCVCEAGYTGDGRSCQRDRTCADLVCDVHAACVYDSDNSQAMCECQSGYTGDGLRCHPLPEFSCNEVNNCDVNAECLFDHDTYTWNCECADGFSGDGYSCTDGEEPIELNCHHCHEHAQCIYDVSRLIFRCLCNPDYTGDGYHCYTIAETCDIARNCHEDATCVYDDLSRGYVCQCNQGYTGDGYLCQFESCNVVNTCNVDARCIYNSTALQYVCVCNPGYVGDGHRCDAEGRCDVNPSMCDINARCVFDSAEYSYTCRCQEGYIGDGRSCSAQEEPCNVLNNCDYNADCLYDRYEQSYSCRCREGYNGDGYRCIPSLDCRRDQSICDPNASCRLHDNNYHCVCNTGYHGDGTRCAPTGDQSSYLMYCQGLSIMRIPFERTDSNPGTQVLMIPGQTAIGIDVDCYSRYFYWTDVMGKTVSRARLDGSDSQVLVRGLGSPEGVAVDWVAGNMYWTDSELDQIEVSKLDGTSRKTLFDTDLVNPRGVVVDPSQGLLFWSDWNRKAPKIEVSSMDGTNRRTLVTEDLSLPNALAIDYEHQQLCWADAGTQHIECVNYDGHGRRVVYSLASYPFGLAYNGNTFYWTDWNMNSLPSIDRYGNQFNAAMILPAGGNGRLYGIAPVRAECPIGSNACVLNNGGCRYLCLPTPNGGRTCVCPDDVPEEQCNQVNE